MKLRGARGVTGDEDDDVFVDSSEYIRVFPDHLARAVGRAIVVNDFGLPDGRLLSAGNDRMPVLKMRWTAAFTIIALLSCMLAAESPLQGPFTGWSLPEAVKILNESPWARQETFTKVVGGVGSGIRGEKEIYNTFFVRLLSSPAIRQAYARVTQIQLGYDQMDQDQQKAIDSQIARGLNLDVRQWIVVSVSFRSNDAGQESQVEQFFQSRTSDTLRTSAYLSTARFPQVALAAYYPPREQTVGAKFVFPRYLDGVPVVSAGDDELAFELLGVPGADPLLRATFSISKMVVDDELAL